MAAKDEELGDQLTDIFVELGHGHIDQIVETQTLTIPRILLKLLQIPYLCNFHPLLLTIIALFREPQIGYILEEAFQDAGQGSCG